MIKHNTDILSTVNKIKGNKMEQKRVVLTGMGTMNPLAHNVEDTWNKSPGR